MMRITDGIPGLKPITCPCPFAVITLLNVDSPLLLEDVPFNERFGLPTITGKPGLKSAKSKE